MAILTNCFRQQSLGSCYPLKCFKEVSRNQEKIQIQIKTMNWLLGGCLLFGIALPVVEMSYSVGNRTSQIEAFLNYTISNMAPGDCVREVP